MTSGASPCALQQLADEFWGKSVFHCPYYHGWEVRDEQLAVVGNGETGIKMAALLNNWSADLVLCTNGKAELSADQRTLLENHRILVREEKIIRLEGDNGRLETIVFETSDKIARHGILIRPKQTLRSNLAEKLGCELNEFNLIKTTNVLNETSVKGVYAAGDITSPPVRFPTQSDAPLVKGGGNSRTTVA